MFKRKYQSTDSFGEEIKRLREEELSEKAANEVASLSTIVILRSNAPKNPLTFHYCHSEEQRSEESPHFPLLSF